MSKIIINSLQEFEAYAGKELGVSEYLKITQDRINLFADATLDHQWIHTDPERAKVESTFKNTIAHGYLTVSLLPHFLDEIIEVRNLKMLVNYGIEKLKFNQAVVVDSEIRLRLHLTSLTNLMGIAKAELKTTIEIKDSPKSALEATVILLYYFNKQ
ncbi:MAG: MaoC family dehydratase [Dysgonomonas sp.]|nr:MaoC family dehydratase [Dysgonomonas sp.]